MGDGVICSVSVGPDHSVAGVNVQISGRKSCADDVYIVSGSTCCPLLGRLP